ncbi:PREDICTED: uncharacterized protein LOC109357291 isoform X2 [Lupinus angustifolius]|uniref:uncharacterized protein LOC109357291 isoform X2 n=1 Tax=Lupinus angustifolius TaxID=3871 RepID=UPI00092EE6CD|nr:PREDICTED: uncharacterized protein LOC109357291 isoform X2 [Lupinus angustifolius]
MFFTKLPLARKAWNSITSTLRKIHKIHGSKSKSMKKTKKHKPTKAIVTKHSRHNRRLVKIKSVIFSLKKKHAPIYIDKLFKESYSCDLVGKLKPNIIAHNNLQLIEKSEKVTHDKGVEEEVGETSKGCNSNDDDNMWESMELASPLMHGIDERAEEFIARFRGEMAAQEKLARNL